MIENHRFGPWSLIPKCSNLTDKDRPLGSYAGRALGKLYRLGGRAIDYVTHIGCAFENRDFGVMKCAKVINASQTLNLDLGQRVMQGWSPQLFPWKRDLDNFFNRVSRSQVIQAWKWALFVFARAKPRRPYLNFPINKFLRREKSRCTTAHTRSFHENLRLQFLLTTIRLDRLDLFMQKTVGLSNLRMFGTSSTLISKPVF